MDATVTPIHKYLRRKGRSLRKKHIQDRELLCEILTSYIATPPASLFREAEYRKPSRAPFASLSRVALRNLNANQVAAGQFLLLRTLEPAFMFDNCVVHVVEDHLGSIISLHLYNYIVKEKELDDFFPNGTIIVIKEPFCELVNDSIAIRVYHPTDVIVVRSCDLQYSSFLSIKCVNKIDFSQNQLLAEPKPSNAEEWKKRGNDLFFAAKYYSAEVAYKLCINEANKSQDETVKNLAMKNLIFVYLKLEQFDQAVEMAERVLEQHPDDSKALFRLGCAYYELREYSKAVKYLEKVYQVDPKDASNNRQLLRARLRLKEQSTGNYSMEHLYRQSKERIGDTGENKLIDVADYVGAVEIKKIDGKSVGVVATEDIKPGTLLVVSKAFQTCFNNEPLTSSNLWGINPDFQKVEGECQRNSSAVCTAVYKNFKTFGKQIYDMLPPAVEQRYCDPQKQQEPILDATEIVKLAYTSSWRNMNEIELRETGDVHAKISNLFFTFPGHIKRSCLPNCGDIMYGNVMIIRALWPISKGEEITISFIHLYRIGFEDRQKLFQGLGYTCDCLLCNLDEQEDENSQSLRREYCASLRSTLTQACFVKFSHAALIMKLNCHIDEILSTYEASGRTSFQTDLYEAYLTLATGFLKMANYKAARETVFKAIGCLGFQLDDLKKLASFVGDNSAAIELKGRVYMGEELVSSLALLTNVLTKKSLLFQHLAEAQMVVTLSNYLVKAVYGDMNMKRIMSPATDQLDEMIRRYKRNS